MKTFVVALAAAMIVPIAGAKDKDSRDQSETSLSKASNVRLSDLMNAKIKSNAGEDLGQLEDVVINPQNGKIEYAVLGRGGFLGIGEKLVPVPWQSVSVQSKKEFTINIDKKKLQSAPTLDKTYSSLEDPGYSVTVYQFFAVPADVGGGETPGGNLQEQDNTSPSGSTLNKDSGSSDSDENLSGDAKAHDPDSASADDSDSDDAAKTNDSSAESSDSSSDDSDAK